MLTGFPSPFDTSYRTLILAEGVGTYDVAYGVLHSIPVEISVDNWFRDNFLRHPADIVSDLLANVLYGLFTSLVWDMKGLKISFRGVSASCVVCCIFRGFLVIALSVKYVVVRMVRPCSRLA